MNVSGDMESSEPQRTPAPVLGGSAPADVHMAYLRRDVDEMKNTMNRSFLELAKTLEDIRDGHPTRDEHADHEKRIRVIEQTMWRYIGASAVIGAAVSFVGSLLIAKL